MKILGGILSPRPVDPEVPKSDLVHGVDSDGRYLGLVQRGDPRCAAEADRAPPAILGERVRWVGVEWRFRRSADEVKGDIERERDAVLSEGVEWGGRRWYADPTFQAQLSSFLTLWREGILPPEESVGVRAMDKHVHRLGREEVVDLLAAVVNHVSGAYVQSWQAKQRAGV